MKVIIVDDSAIIRAILEQNFKKQSFFKDIEIVDSVSTGRKAIDSAKKYAPNLMISDIDMPEMNGLEATKIISSELKIPIILMAEDENSFVKAISAGATDFIAKPNLSSYNKQFFEALNDKIRKCCKSNLLNNSNFSKATDDSNEYRDFKILCIGASTGGPTAVAEVLKGLGTNFPLPIIYSQHIEIGSDEKMAEWFSQTCSNIKFKIATDGEEAKNGVVYMAPADRHLVIDYIKPNGTPILKLSNAPAWRFLRPAVNIMFDSACKFFKKDCLAVLLTGMGRDGADSCKNILNNGGYTIVEDESTCAVFGMPKAAIEEGGAKEVLPREKIARRIKALVGGL